MRPVKSEVIDGKTVITTEYTETRWLFFKRTATRKFVAVDRMVGEYWTWLELPDYSLVPDRLSFQLNEWKKHGIGH